MANTKTEPFIKSEVFLKKSLFYSIKNSPCKLTNLFSWLLTSPDKPHFWLSVSCEWFWG
jgi:hypothetical protein